MPACTLSHYEGGSSDGFLITVNIKPEGSIGGNGVTDDGSTNPLVISYFDESNALTDLAWTRTMVGRNDGDILLERLEHAKITVDLTATAGAVGISHSFILEIKPESGPVLVIQHTTPPAIDDVTMLR